MTKGYGGSGERVKLISELLMAFKRHMPKYTGIEKKRLEVQVKKMNGYLEDEKFL